MSSITVGGKNLKYSNLSKEQIERILESANDERSKNHNKDVNDEFLEFLKSKEFSNLYKEVHDIINKEVHVKLKFACVNIEMSYFVDDFCYDEVTCRVDILNIDNEFYNQFNKFPFLKNAMYDAIDLHPDGIIGEEFEKYFYSISSYKGKNKELLKAKNAFNKIHKELNEVFNKTELIENKFKLRNNVGVYTSLFDNIRKSRTLTDARKTLMSY